MSLHVCVCVCAQLLNHVSDSATPRTITRQTLLSIGFSRQEYWNRLPFLPSDFPNPGIEPMAPVSPALAGRFFITEPLQKLIYTYTYTHTHTYVYV